ncbi:MAG: hypothetical protein U0529_02345 [Thermoanaerobaculia bacterium]
MTSTRSVPALLSLAVDGNRPASDGTDGDDGIDIASVTRLDRSTGPVLRVVVRWLEGGRWVARTVELPDR